MEDTGNTCFLMNQESEVLAQGVLQSAPDATNIQVKVTGGLADQVVSAGTIQVVPLDESRSVDLGQVIFRRGNLVVLEPLRRLGREVRRNLRVGVRFTSYIYPESGGRAVIESHDMSCGGVAFFTERELLDHERFEIVIPITRVPLLLRGEVLRSERRRSDQIFCAAKFVDIIDDEEKMLRASVFSAQILSASQRPRGAESR